ncbi:MAG: GGDEF domain-containing protein [Chloroflexi bacterium]|nr:GGDEF domain-containing protein [Chloroflexota bacterium]
MNAQAPAHSAWRTKRRPVWRVTLAGVVVTALLGLVDYYMMPSTAPLYLLPVAFTTWLAGPRAGVLIALCGAVASYLGEQTLVDALGISSTIAAWNALANLLTLIPTAFILDLLREELEKAQSIALTDHLTGAGNARAFSETAEAELRRARRYTRPLTMAFIDVDNFKAINDRYGHSRGDELLRLIAATMRVNLRLTDSVTRLGGDEFGLLLPETDAAQARGAIDKLRAALEAAMSARSYPVTFSIGVMTFTSPPASVDELLRQSDALMYEVKSGSKNDARYAIRN